MKVSKKLLDQLYKGRTNVELTIGTLKDGQIETLHLDPERKKSKEQLVYPVGSIGKPFTASLLAKLISEGKMDLSEALDRYIPGLPKQYYPSILRLATHHSGYGNAPYKTLQVLKMFLQMNKPNGIMHVNPYRGFPDKEKMMEVLRDMPMSEKEQKFQYCNFAYGVLGYIVGQQYGTDFYGAMTDYFKELGLGNTSLDNSTMTGYDKKGNPCKPWQWERTDIVAPAGAMLSTVEDLLKFAQLNMDGSHPYLDICHQKHAAGEKTFDQGLAWRIKKDSSILYHSGNAGAFSCILAMDTERKTGVCIAINHALVELEKPAFDILSTLEGNTHEE